MPVISSLIFKLQKTSSFIQATVAKPSGPATLGDAEVLRWHLWAAPSLPGSPTPCPPFPWACAQDRQGQGYNSSELKSNLSPFSRKLKSPISCQICSQSEVCSESAISRVSVPGLDGQIPSLYFACTCLAGRWVLLQGVWAWTALLPQGSPSFQLILSHLMG